MSFKPAILVAVYLISEMVLANSGITYHGRLQNPDGTPVTSSNVQFRMQIRTPGSEDCLMYEELQTLDLSNSKGVFSLSIGNGGGVRQDTNAWGLFDSLSNRVGFSFNGGDCNGGPASYTPGVRDNRNFRVLFNDGTFAGWEALPLQTVNYIPMSIESYAVGGFPASSLLRVENAGSLVNTSPLNNAQYTELLALLSGTSNQYTRAGQLNGVALPAIGNGESVRWNAGAWQSFTPLTSETDPNVEAFAKAALPTCDPGEILTGDGTALTCVADATGGAPSDATTAVKGIVVVPAAGGLAVSGGSLSIPDQAGVTPGTYPKVTVNQKGLITAHSNLVQGDIPQLTSAGNGVEGGAITTGTIGGTTAINTSGNIVTTGNMTGAGISATTVSSRGYRVYNAGNTNYVSLEVPAGLAANYSMILPSTNGTGNQILGMNNGATGMEYKSITQGSGVTITHSAGGIEIAATGSGGTLTGITGTANQIAVDSSTPAVPVLSLADLAVSPAGSYGSATQVPAFTVDAKGRVTAVTNTNITGVSPVGSALASGQSWMGTGGNLAAARYIGLGDIKTAAGTQQIPTSCSASQTMVWSAITDVLSCTNISIAGSQVTGLDAANVSNTAAGNIAATDVQAAINELDSEKVAKTGDTMTGTLILPANGLVAGATQLVLSGGFVGVGTASPTTALDVSGVITTNDSVVVDGVGTGVLVVQAGLAPAAPVAGDANIFVNENGMLDCHFGVGNSDCMPTSNTASGNVSGNVTMTTVGTFYDSASVSVAEGTWMIQGTTTLQTTAANTISHFTCKLWDGTTAVASSEQTASNNGSAVARTVSISLSAVVSPSATTVYKVSCTSTLANQIIRAATPNNGSGDNASTLIAVRLK